MTKLKTIEWLDRHREPQCPPDPRFPDGVDLDLSKGRMPVCTVALEHPAKRCGAWLITCPCGNRIMVTTAGRPDDPRSVKIACLK